MVIPPIEPVAITAARAKQTWWQHLGHSRRGRVTWLLTLLSSSAMLLYHHLQQQQQLDQMSTELQQRIAQQQQQLQSRQQEQQQLQRNLPLFRQLPLQTTPRLHWLEQLNHLQQNYSLQFQLAAQQALSLPAQQLRLHFNPLQLQLNLAHEQQLLDLLSELHHDPWFRLRHCQLQRQTDSAQALLVHCQGGWLTLSLTDKQP